MRLFVSGPRPRLGAVFTVPRPRRFTEAEQLQNRRVALAWVVVISVGSLMYYLSH